MIKNKIILSLKQIDCNSNDCFGYSVHEKQVLFVFKKIALAASCYKWPRRKIFKIMMM